ncbi:conserved hypothetical protein [Methanocaldococcus sp. FS406-22]|uniref:hypothetical protein n=1 Tax=Methanocaldococcus sp. (strain FS406-22) TaxID=644281 RepID=UPI0001C4E126|nr:hypothetical protein [Methanocaldococcus sp. FS406-22]ADC68957.1 conserved hypothetical protein [Methanocaldococcus sp. FS406-22]
MKVYNAYKVVGAFMFSTSILFVLYISTLLQSFKLPLPVILVVDVLIILIFAYLFLKPKKLVILEDGIKIDDEFYSWNDVIEFFVSLNSIQINLKGKREETFNWETPGLFKYRPQIEYVVKKDTELLKILRKKIGHKERKRG